MSASEATQHIDGLNELVFANFDGDVEPSSITPDALVQYRNKLSQKAPLALKKAMRLIEEGNGVSLQNALQLELDGLVEIFSSADALVGLSGILTGCSPIFKGT